MTATPSRTFLTCSSSAGRSAELPARLENRVAKAFRWAGLALLPILAACPAPRDQPVGSAEDESGSSGAVADDAGDDLTTGVDPTMDDGNASDDDADAETDDGNDGLDDATDGGDSDGGSDGGSESGSTGGPPSCADEGGACIPSVPDGWQGPAIVREWSDTSTPAECDSVFDLAVATSASHGLVAPVTSCECDCGEPEGGACQGEVTLNRTTILNGLCSLIQDEIGSLDPNTSTSLDETGPVGVLYTITEDPEYVGGSCDPESSENIPPAYFQHNVTLCAGDPLPVGDCGADEMCAPLPEEEEPALCIWQEGATFCPVEFPEQLVVYEDLEDTRACTECWCGTPSGACSDGGVTVYGTHTTLGIPLIQSGTPQDCEPYNSAAYNVTAANWGGVTPTSAVGCEANGGEPTGAATGVAPITICCAGL